MGKHFRNFILMALLISAGTLRVNGQSLSDSSIVMGTPYEIENGNGYFRNYFINYNLIGIGVGDQAFLKAGFGIGELFDEFSSSYYLQPSVSFPIQKNLKLNLGVTFASFTNVLTHRTLDVELSTRFNQSALQLGFSVGSIDSDEYDEDLAIPLFKVNYSVYLTSKSALILENRIFNGVGLYLEIENDDFGPISTNRSSLDFVSLVAYRYLGKKAGFDAGFIAVYDFPDGNDGAIPYFGFVIPFSRFTE